MPWFNQRLNVIRLTLVSAILFTGFAAAVFRTPPILFMAALLWSAPVTVVCAGRLGGRGLEVRRVMPRVGRVGEVLEVRLTLTNRARWPAFLARVRCGQIETLAGERAAVEAIGGDEHIAPLLRPGQSVTWTQGYLLRKRGAHVIEPARAGASDPLGLWSRLDFKTDGAELLVLPRALHLDRIGAWGSASNGLHAPRFAASVADATDFHGIRPWRPGEGIRRAHWKSTARTGELHIIEWEEDVASDIALLLDAQALVHARAPGMEGESDTFEAAVTLAASVASHLLQNGYGFQLFFWQDAPHTAPHLSMAGRWSRRTGETASDEGPRLRRFDGRSSRESDAVQESLARLQPVRHEASSLAHLARCCSPLIAPGRSVLLLSTTNADISSAMAQLGLSQRGASPPCALLLDAESFTAPEVADDTHYPAHFEASTRGDASSNERAAYPPNVRVVKRGDSLSAALEQTL